MDELTEKEREFLLWHEAMHQEARRRLGVGHLSAEEVFALIMERE